MASKLASWLGTVALVATFCVLLALAGCAGEPPADDTAASRDPGPADAPRAAAVVGDSSVGCVRLGAPVDAVKRACGATADTTIHLEGMPHEALWVDVSGGRALAEVVDDSVWRIRVRDGALTTRDSIAVGTPVRALAGLPGIRIVHGEGTFAMTDAHCGKSFEVGGAAFRSGGWSAEELRDLPDSARVVGILVHGGCSGR